MKFNNMEKDQLFIMHVVIDLIYMLSLYQLERTGFYYHTK